MGQYKTLDFLIFNAIEAWQNPIHYDLCEAEATRITKKTGRDAHIIIGSRLQALRKAGHIQQLTKSESRRHGGWKVVVPNGQS